MLSAHDSVIRAILEVTPVGMLLVDAHGQVVFCNNRACTILAWDGNDLPGQHINALIPDRYRSAHEVSRKGYNKQPEARSMGGNRDLLALTKDGREIPVEVGLSPVSLGGNNYVLVSMLDISDRKRAEDLEAANSRLAHMATHDPLTDLPNRAQLLSILDDALTTASDGNAVTLAFVDLDGFKAVNDQHGHDLGDKLLKAVADILRSLIRRSDFLGRLGGDEFLLVFRGTDAGHGIQKTLKGILRAIKHLRHVEDKEVSITASIGAVTCSAGANISAEVLIKHADQLMYQAKHQGKNRLVAEHISAESIELTKTQRPLAR
ncbi:sensor domain-containing diguanylate cyclase [Marinimicrobium sp. ABcell2]|uniref:sensor domain-containing diguanylate cyclase n=1 Tax=Marinimicrobium sp. ABcell2 TaxID=3069751 RepID=UPI0027ADF35D|nr:sensor domain-containing diguanylate cyclase [Marinimicrobium sp. ABcell2]MDQ2075973.1 sensor domain-containing diguanylate cyclase [Marinimicrobium sp. ABcell2]